MFNGWKTYAGGFGLIFLGLGGLLSQKVDLFTGLTEICGGLVAVGLRSFGSRALQMIETFRKPK